MAAMIPVEIYERLISARQERFSIIDKIRSQQAEFPAEEVAEDVRQAIAGIRENAEKSCS